MEDKLRQRWSPQQISRRLIIDFPQDASMRVSHETIYSSQFVQTNAVLRTELIAHLRTRLVRRRPHRKAIPRTESRRIQNMVPLGERPEEVLDRRVPGTGKGDLLVDRYGRSHLVTLVERHSSYLIVLPLTDATTTTSSQP